VFSFLQPRYIKYNNLLYFSIANSCIKCENEESYIFYKPKNLGGIYYGTLKI
jgi:hypothetical protein